jgi:hypothetical protein
LWIHKRWHTRPPGAPDPYAMAHAERNGAHESDGIASAIEGVSEQGTRNRG